MSLILMQIPVNRDHEQPVQGIEIFVFSNGVHTDFVVPVESELINWQPLFPMKDFKIPGSVSSYIAFGWGDKGFYLEIPTWDDLTFKIAAKAVLIPSSTVMHVQYIDTRPVLGEYCKSLRLTNKQYKILIDYIHNSFDLDPDGNHQLIQNSGYYNNDNFYEAKYSYHLFNTCNDWTNTGLKKMGVKTSAWAPFQSGVLYHL